MAALVGHPGRACGRDDRSAAGRRRGRPSGAGDPRGLSWFGVDIDHEPATIAFYFTLVCGVASAVALPWGWQTPSLADGAMFLLLGLLGGSAYVLVLRAYAVAPAAVIAPFDYLHILWAIVLGFVVWGDAPGRNVALGAAVVIASGLYIVHRETTLGRRPLAGRKMFART